MRIFVRYSAMRRDINCRGMAARCNTTLLVWTLLLFLSYNPSLAQVFSNATIQTSDGILLDATITKPTGTPPSGGFPAIVLVHGFGGSKIDMGLYSVLVAAYGYASIAYSVRGQGNSGGLSTIGGDRERQDLLEVIQYFRNVQDINPNKLGVTGGSQGGIHSWMAAMYRMPGVRAVAPLFATADYASALTPNGCVKYGLVRELNLGAVRYANERERMHGFIVSDNYDSVLAYIDSRDLAHFIDSVQIPVLQGLGWADFLFPINGGIATHKKLTARNIPIWSYFGTNGHDEVINTNEAAFLLDVLVRWFDHWLKGSALNPDSLSLVMYSDDRPNWPHHSSTTLPPQPSGTLRFYITQTGLSQSLPASSGTFPFSLIHNPSYAPAMGWDDRYGGQAFVTSFSNTSTRFVSPVLGTDTEVTGIPGGRIFVQSNDEKFQAHVRIYDVMDVDTGRVWKHMSRAINGIRNNTPGEIHKIAVEGSALSHIVAAGHRIGVEVTSMDMLDAEQANTIPYFVSSHSQLLTSPSSASYIELPVVLGRPADVAGYRPALPTAFVLEQNYPNPFNPSTTIRFELTTPAFVTLKVYDMLGREAATLVNQELPPGRYGQTFEANGLASGVYFYRLLAGTFAETRRMIFLR